MNRKGDPAETQKEEEEIRVGRGKASSESGQGTLVSRLAII